MWKDFLARHALVLLLFFSVSSFKWLKRLFFITFSFVSLFSGDFLRTYMRQKIGGLLDTFFVISPFL